MSEKQVGVNLNNLSLNVFVFKWYDGVKEEKDDKAERAGNAREKTRKNHRKVKDHALTKMPIIVPPLQRRMKQPPKTAYRA